MTRATVAAVGGTREVPVPDDVARDYILLGLRLDQHLPGTVDGYYGPAELKAMVDMAQLRSPARLADDAADLRSRLPREVAQPDRRSWLDAQLVAIETLARVKAGEPIAYLEQVERCLNLRPERRPDEAFEQAARELDALLPGPGSLADRLASVDAAWTVDPARVTDVVDRLLPRYRDRAAALFGLPEGEALRVSFVRDQPWSGYNWYDGGLRSRVDFNLDLPIRLPTFVGVIAHETFPGHHLEHAMKEVALVEALGYLEASILLINTPECLLSEGLANVGRAIAVPPAEMPDLLVELAPVAGLPMAGDPGALRAAAARQGAIAELRATLAESRINAALMLHVDGASAEDAMAYLVDVGRLNPDTAAQRVEFVSHPLWRLYDYVYTEGERLLWPWLHAVPDGQQAARFGRLLREPLTPAAIRAETAGEGRAASGPC
jgi:hypothetical protein